jgi:hypothetical protein
MSLVPFCPRTASSRSLLSSRWLPGALLWGALAAACGSTDDSAQRGALELGLTTEAGGVTYRLSQAHFTLEGPEQRSFSAQDEDLLELELPAGAYRLSLLDGYALTRIDDPAAPPVRARLISQNPAPVLISAGQTSRATLRFTLEESSSLGVGSGVLQVAIEVGHDDAGTRADQACASGLRINEVDYEQANSDELEFIELLNTGSCPAPLEGVQLELVNGGDGKVYSRYALADVAPTLAPGARLVLGDPMIVAALPSEVARTMLNGSGLQNGPDAIRLVRADTLLDALAYEGSVTGSSEGQPSPTDEAERALSRCPDGFDTGDGALDVKLAAPTPGTGNTCS